MDINKKNRSDLKSYFVKNSIPTESNFAELIDGMLNQKDDGIVKLSGDPLSIESAGELAGLQKVINFYAKFQDANPSWSLQLNSRTDPNTPSTAKAGFCVADGQSVPRLFIDKTTGNLGVGTITPQAKLTVVGAANINDGKTLSLPANSMVSGSLTMGSTAINYGGGQGWQDNSGNSTVGLLLQTLSKTEIGVHHSTGRLDSLMYYEGDAVKMITIGRDMAWGNTPVTIAGNLTVNGAITPSVGNSASNGVIFKNNIGGDTSDSAWIRYYARSAELMTLEIGTANENTDHIAFMPSGNVGIGLNNPGEKLEVKGGRIKADALTTGSWPVDAQYVFWGTNALDQASAGNYALLQRINGDTFLNSPNNVYLRVGNLDKIIINRTGTIISEPLAVNADPNIPNYSLNVNVASGKSIKLGLEGNGGGQLILANNPNDNKIYLEAFSKDGKGSAAELLLTGQYGANVPKLSLLADSTSVSGNLIVKGCILEDNPLINTNYTIELCGSALESTEGNITFLKVNNSAMDMTIARGLNTVILNPNGSYKNKANHDVYLNAATWNTWADWVNNNAAFGDIVAVATYDAINNAPRGGSADILLSSILAEKAYTAVTANNRTPYTLVFMKGGVAMEAASTYKGTNAHLNAISCKLPINRDQWRNAVLINNWVRWDNTYNPAQYFKDSKGLVSLRGLVKSGPAGSVIFTLPEGYRPNYRQLHVVCANDAVGRVDIPSSGQVVHVSGPTGWVCLDSISFSTKA